MLLARSLNAHPSQPPVQRVAALVCALSLVLTLLPWGTLQRAHAAPAHPLILVHYMPWFEGKPNSGRWGWHWTMNAFDPDAITAGKRHIAAPYYPLIGPYDSSDRAVIEYHLLLMKLAGIDGIIIDWYGTSNLFDYPIIHQNTIALVKAAGALGMKVAICYEDQTITRLVQQKRIEPKERLTQARADLDWLRQNWFTDPAYLTLNGKPVLLSFGYDGLSDDEWTQLLSPKADAPVYLSEHRRRPAAAGVFDWPQPDVGLSSLDTFYGAAKYWPLAMPAAYPRFHDFYAQAKVSPSYGEIPDDAGRTFSTTLGRALKSNAPFIQIVTWNDWGEGTVIEPSLEFGYRDLEVIQSQRQAWREREAPASADDLRLPERLLALRRSRAGQNAALVSEMDKIAQLLAQRATPAARAALARLEAKAKPAK